MKDITIGITINIKESETIWNNGIIQNVINFALLLKNSKNNYNVLIVNTSEINKLHYNLEGVDIYPMEDKYKDLDILFILGSQIYDHQYSYLKNNKCKIVYYNCGSNYIIDMQNVLFKPDTTKTIYHHIPDEVWIIPQNYETNKYYHETIYKTKSIEVPFVWSPTFIDYLSKSSNTDFKYVPSNNSKRISCFEPNIDVVKYSMYCILIVEQLYDEKPELINHFYITNSEKIKINPLFVNTMNMLNIVKDKKATFESRFRTPYFLKNYTDIVISHQWQNPLNYAYLDALYLNYPLVHNASMIKDAGYYYNGFNVKQGKEQLLKSIIEHDKYIDKYNEKNKSVLERYLPTNEKSIDIYDKLISKLLKK